MNQIFERIQLESNAVLVITRTNSTMVQYGLSAHRVTAILHALLLNCTSTIRTVRLRYI